MIMSDDRDSNNVETSGFEAWASGPVHRKLWASMVKFKHPVYKDNTLVMVGDMVRLAHTDKHMGGDYMVLNIRAEQRGLAEEPVVELGEPFEDPKDVVTAYASSKLSLSDLGDIVRATPTFDFNKLSHWSEYRPDMEGKSWEPSVV